MAKVFSGTVYALSHTLAEDIRVTLSALLDANGATPALPSDEKLTHYISGTLPKSQLTDPLPEDSDAHVVTPFWVERSASLAARQEESGYSPDPTLIFSGVIATAADLSTPDLEVLSAGISALGGQWRTALTREVTHLFALSTGSLKYNTAMDVKDDMGICILVPHWFDDCVRLGQRIPPNPYEWPEPKVFAASWGLEADKEKPRISSQLSPEKDAVYASVFQKGKITKGKNVWKGAKVTLSLELTESQRRAHEADITREGGMVVKGNDVEETDVVIMRHRAEPIYSKALKLGKTIGTLPWLWYVRSTGRISDPTTQLLHYPIPPDPVEGFSSHVITVTNYTGPDREYLKKLIMLLGAQFTPDMTGSNTVVIAASLEGKKTQKAVSWSIPIVNHLWLEDCIIQWRHLSLAQSKYTLFPSGVDFGKLLGERGIGRVGYPKESEGAPAANRLGPAATGQSAKEVEDVIMDVDGDLDEGPDEGSQGVEVDGILPYSGASKAKTSSKTSPTNTNPRASKPQPRHDDLIDGESADPPSAKPSRKLLKRRVGPGSVPDIGATLGLSAKTHIIVPVDADVELDAEAPEKDEEPIAPLESPKPRLSQSMRKRPAHRGEDVEMNGDAITTPAPKHKQSMRRTYGKSKANAVAINGDKSGTDEDVSPTKPPSKGSHRSPKRTLSVLLPTYDQVKSASQQRSPSRTRDSPQRGRVAKSSRERTPNELESSSPASLHSPPTKKATSKTRLLDTPEPGPSKPLQRAKIAETPDSENLSTSSRMGSKRFAATKAVQKLRDEIMPDVVNFQKELKSGNIRSNWDREQAETKRKESKEAEKEKQGKGKKRVPAGGEDNADSDREGRPDRKKRRTSGGGSKPTARGRGRGVDSISDEENDEPVAKSPSKSGKGETKTSGGKISKRDPGSIVIMTTQVNLADDVQKTMAKLGVKFTAKPSECTHLVARSIVRTEKFLCAMAIAPFIVTEKWVQTCATTKHILVEDDFLLSDPQSEKKYNFALEDALARARQSKGGLFAGMTFLITPKVPVDAKLLKNVVIAGGGQAVINSSPTIRTMKNKNKYIISCPADVSIWRFLSEQDIPIYSQELILNGALRQDIDWDNLGNKVEGSYS